MMIYAIFVCIVSTGTCSPTEGGRYSPSFGYIQPTVYRTLADCQKAIKVYGTGYSGMKYRCLGKRVETWN